jgi:hypothetical protein
MPLRDFLDSLWIDALNFLSDAATVAGVPSYNDLPPPPTPEPAAVNSLDELTAEARAAMRDLETQFTGILAPVGWAARRVETVRTPERQRWLWGIGREYQALGRTGIVTNAKTPSGPHVLRRAVDYRYVAAVPGTHPDVKVLEEKLKQIAASRPDLTWGGNFVLESGDHDAAHWELKA